MPPCAGIGPVLPRGRLSSVAAGSCAARRHRAFAPVARASVGRGAAGTFCAARFFLSGRLSARDRSQADGMGRRRRETPWERPRPGCDFGTVRGERREGQGVPVQLEAIRWRVRVVGSRRVARLSSASLSPGRRRPGQAGRSRRGRWHWRRRGRARGCRRVGRRTSRRGPRAPGRDWPRRRTSACRA